MFFAFLKELHLRSTLVFLIPLLLHSPQSSLALDNRLSRFLPKTTPATPTPSLTLPPIPGFSPTPASVKDHNIGVDLNNEGLRFLQAGDVQQAIKLLYQATEADPAENSFWHNLLVALKRDPRRGQEALDVGYKLLGLKPSSPQALFGLGMVFHNQLKQSYEALPFLYRAHQIAPDDVETAIALASAWERCGFPDQSMELLKQYAHRVKDDPYPHYLLGLLLLGREEFPAAIRALTSAAERDAEGFAHEALVRARYLGGQLNNLGQVARNVLTRFPQVLNRDSLQRLSFSLNLHTVRFFETIRIDITDSDTIKNFHVRVRPLPEMADHQQVRLDLSEWIIGSRKFPALASPPDADGRVSFSMQDGSVAPTVYLRLGYTIQIVPWLVGKGKFQPTSQPDLDELKGMPGLSLDDPLLEELHQALSKLPGNGLQNLYLAVGRGLTYKENFEEHPVSWALLNPDLCDCTEYSNLLAALSLKRGIPARVVTGFLIKSDLLGKETNVGHAWVETWFSDKGWVPLDPTLGPNMRWAYFGNLLSDQILFERPSAFGKARVSVDVTSTRNNLSIKISSSFLCNLVK